MEKQTDKVNIRNEYKENKRHTSIGDIIKYYLRKEKENYNDK